MPKIEIEVSDEQLTKLTNKNLDGPIKIAILQRGWVFVGRYSKEGTDCKLENASCIRQWGTTKGLGELVSGPTKTTLLDASGTVEFHELGIVALISVDQKTWGKLC